MPLASSTSPPSSVGLPVRVNEPLTLTVTLSGEGNLDTMADPNWPDLPGWRAFDGSATISSQVVDNKLTGSRVYERLLVPGSPGEFTIPPVTYTFFDPETAEYRTVSTSPLAVNVSPGDRQAPVASVPGAAREGVERLASDIRFIKPAPTVLGAEESRVTGSVAYWLAWGIPLAAFVAGVALRRRARRFEGDISLARRTNAFKRARGAVARARRDGSDHHEASGRILTRYIGDRLNQQVSGLTHDALSTLLAEHGVDGGLIERVRASLVTSEGGRFAPAGADDRVGDILLETDALAEELEKGFWS